VCIHLKKASRLTISTVHLSQVESGSLPDTYVRLQLMHQAKEVKRKKTSVVKRDDCPQYKESFNFRLEEADFDKAGLKVTCLQHNQILERGW